MEGRASPRKPRVAMERRSSEVRSLLVAWRSKARRASSLTMPWPLSAMRMSLRPPASTSMRMRVAPASREFSRSSLTTEAGRSTTSPGGDLVRHDVRQDSDAAHRWIVEAATVRKTGAKPLASYAWEEIDMIRKLKTGEFRIYSRHSDPKTGKRKNLGTFATREKAEEHERAIQYFKRH